VDGGLIRYAVKRRGLDRGDEERDVRQRASRQRARGISDGIERWLECDRERVRTRASDVQGIAAVTGTDVDDRPGVRPGARGDLTDVYVEKPLTS